MLWLSFLKSLIPAFDGPNGPGGPHRPDGQNEHTILTNGHDALFYT